MKSWMVPPLVAVAVLALLVLSAVNSTDASGDSGQTRDAAAHSHTHGSTTSTTRATRVTSARSATSRQADKADRGHGHGPPRWAHRNDSSADSSVREMWRKLTPEQRRSLMAELFVSTPKACGSGKSAWPPSATTA